MLPISANTGIGVDRDAARSNSARPAFCEPVKPTACDRRDDAPARR